MENTRKSIDIRKCGGTQTHKNKTSVHKGAKRTVVNVCMSNGSKPTHTFVDQHNDHLQQLEDTPYQLFAKS